MRIRRIGKISAILTSLVILGGCGQSDGLFGGINRLGKSIFGGPGASAEQTALPANPTAGSPPPVRVLEREPRRGLFGLGASQQSASDQVNAYLWRASLEVLNFLPLRAADPFSGRIQTGFGRAPGAARTYRVDIHITSGRMDASALQLAVYSQSGRATHAEAALRDAIFLRARQLKSVAG